MKKMFIIAVFCALLFCFSMSLFAGTVVLKNGNAISGHVEKDEHRSVTLRFPFGKMTIWKSYVIDNGVAVEGSGMRKKQALKRELDFSGVESEWKRLKADLDKELAAEKERVKTGGQGPVIAAKRSRVFLASRFNAEELNASFKTIRGWKTAFSDGIYDITGPRDIKKGFTIRATVMREKTFYRNNRAKQVELFCALTFEGCPSWKQTGEVFYEIDNLASGQKIIKFARVNGTFEKQGLLTNFSQFYVWKEDYTYTFSFTYLPEQAESYKLPFELMVRSLRAVE